MFEAILKTTGVESAEDFHLILKEGGNEAGIVEGSMGKFRFVAVSADSKEPVVLRDATFSSMSVAVTHLIGFLNNEYPA